VWQLQHESEDLLGTELQIGRTRSGGQQLIALLFALLLLPALLSAQPPDDLLRTSLSQLRDADFADKEAIVERLSRSGHASTQAVLTAFLDDRLYFSNHDQSVFIVNSSDEALTTVALIDPVSLAAVGSAGRADVTKITTNNRLRRTLRTTVARFGLTHPDPAVRLAAVTDMLRRLDSATITLLQQRVDAETDRAVQQQIRTGLALAALDDVESKARLEAIATLAANLNIDVRTRLARLVEQDADGAFTEGDPTVRTAAAAAIRRIDRARIFYSWIQTLFFGLSVGSVLVLIAIGLAITFGLMGVINMAHGEFMMLGAYATYVVQLWMPHAIGASILVAIPAAFGVAALGGILLERTIIRFLYGRPLETLLATFGVSLILQQLVRTVFTANNRSVLTPAWMSGTLQFNPVLSITYNRLYIVIFTLIVFAILMAVLRRTRLGLDIRAVSQNRAMAQAMGIRTEWVDALTFGLGSGIAGIAGVALSQFTNVGPNLGQSYIIDSFMVVVFGGVGNLWGMLVGGFSMGVVNQLLEPYAGAVMAKIVVLVTLILFIQRWPRGLFPQTGRAAENQP
jgi:urea transport system permease protein